jgi:hypothetical protein
VSAIVPCDKDDTGNEKAGIHKMQTAVCFGYIAQCPELEIVWVTPEGNEGRRKPSHDEICGWFKNKPSVVEIVRTAEKPLGISKASAGVLFNEGMPDVRNIQDTPISDETARLFAKQIAAIAYCEDQTLDEQYAVELKILYYYLPETVVFYQNGYDGGEKTADADGIYGTSGTLENEVPAEVPAVTPLFERIYSLFGTLGTSDRKVLIKKEKHEIKNNIIILEEEVEGSKFPSSRSLKTPISGDKYHSATAPDDGKTGSQPQRTALVATLPLDTQTRLHRYINSIQIPPVGERNSGCTRIAGSIRKFVDTDLQLPSLLSQAHDLFIDRFSDADNYHEIASIADRFIR